MKRALPSDSEHVTLVSRPLLYNNNCLSNPLPAPATAVGVHNKLVVVLPNIKEISVECILPLYQFSVFVGLLLSGGWVVIKRPNNTLARIKFRQSYSNKEYVYYVFNAIYPYCARSPYCFISNNQYKGKPVHEILIATK